MAFKDFAPAGASIALRFDGSPTLGGMQRCYSRATPFGLIYSDRLRLVRAYPERSRGHFSRSRFFGADQGAERSRVRAFLCGQCDGMFL